MRDNQSDGRYTLEFIRENGKKEGIGAGYYTNGGSLDSWVLYKIERDTTLVKFSGKGY